MDTYEQVERIRETLRQVAKQVEHLGIALCRPGAEEKPEPKFKVGDWLRHPTDARAVEILSARWADAAWCYGVQECSLRDLRVWGSSRYEAAIEHWLSIPPKPDPPEGIRLTGEVRVPKEGECWLQPPCGIWSTWAGGDRPTQRIFGGRRWIAKRVPKPEHWQDAYKTCPKCREAVEVPEADSVMFECGAWQRRDGVFVPSVQCLQNQADQLKAAQEKPHV